MPQVVVASTLNVAVWGSRYRSCPSHPGRTLCFMSLGRKWIDVRPEGSVAEAARVSLSARLAAVGHWLPLAAASAAEDIEHVHQLRVTTRRAAAGLRLYREWLPPKEYRWIKNRLKMIRRAAGRARDLDVLGIRIKQTLGDDGAFFQALADRRAAAQDEIVLAAERLRRNERLARKVRKLLDGIQVRDAKSHEEHTSALEFRAWAHEQVSRVLVEFFAAEPQRSGDTAALHQFRIATKRLRYAMELLAPAFESELRQVQYPVVEALQERLGRINDLVVGAQHLRGWSAELTDQAVAEQLEQLAARDEAQLAGEVKSLGAWWTPERAERLRHGVESLERGKE